MKTKSNNKVQLSIFDLKSEQQNFDTLNKKLNQILGLDNRPDTKLMLDAILANPTSFREPQRQFIKQCALNFMFDRVLTDKQLDYLHALYKQVPKAAVKHHSNEGRLTLVRES